MDVKEADDLKGSADPQFRARMRLQIVQPFSLIENLPTGDVIHPADQIEEGRLPGSVGADDGVDPALFHIDRNILQGGKTAENLFRPFEFQGSSLVRIHP